MAIYFRGRMYQFRECDTKGMSEAHVIALADKYGRLQREVSGLKVREYLVVRGVGYGWLVD